MIRSVYEGVAYNSKWLLKYVENFAGKKFDSINIIGGGAKSSLWCQILADVLDRKINQVNEPRHANARGAAALAIVALGYGTFEDIAKKTSIDKTYLPNPENRKIYDELFKEYLNIYSKNNKMYARLNKK
jgi:xylulokinase